jgi:hypothetical protein
MNLYVLTKTTKIIQYTKNPASGPLRGTLGEKFLIFLSLIRRGSAPTGAVAFIVTEELK